MKISFIKTYQLQGAKKAVMPRIIHPELCKTATTPSNHHWLHEIKFDGYRIVTFIDRQKIKLISRNQKDWTDKFSEIANALKNFNAKKIILDGELVALDNKGISRFQLLQNYFENKIKTDLAYYIFDILYYDNYDLTQVSLIKRKNFLQQLLDSWKNKPVFIHYSEHIQGYGQQVFAEACRYGAEGIISKRSDSIYQQQRSKNWIKSKCLHQQEFVIGGYTEPSGSRQYFGALLLGYYNNKNELIYCGHVGTGFNQATLKQIYQHLHANEQSSSPFSNPPQNKHIHWTKPELVAQIEFLEWTDDDILRQPSFQGLREDKNPREVNYEPISKASLKTKKIIKSKEKLLPELADNRVIIAGINISHPKKLLYADPTINKQQLIHYYAKIAKRILPFIVNRPLTLLRCPEGTQAKCFFQKHYDSTLPENIFSIKIKNEKEPYLYIKDLAGLLTLIQLNVLEIHPWGSTIDDLDKPDQMIFDLDPSPEVTWHQIIECASSLRQYLQQQGLKTFLKTSGGKGLHIVTPLTPKANWQEVTEFARNIAENFASQNPQKYIATMSKSKRQHKIFIDYLRNMAGATAIAPYCIRAQAGAAIATPIFWKELSRIKSAQQFKYTNINKRLAHLKKDPWQDFFKIKQRL